MGSGWQRALADLADREPKATAPPRQLSGPGRGCFMSCAELWFLEPVMNLAMDGGLEPSTDRTQTSRILVSCGSDAGS